MEKIATSHVHNHVPVVDATGNSAFVSARQVYLDHPVIYHAQQIHGDQTVHMNVPVRKDTPMVVIQR